MCWIGAVSPIQHLLGEPCVTVTLVKNSNKTRRHAVIVFKYFEKLMVHMSVFI